MSEEHRHDFGATGWPFTEPESTTALTTVHVIEYSKPILLVTHDADDEMWQILCGTTDNPKDGRIVCLACMLMRDKTLAELADLPLGWIAFRDGPTQPWVREPRASDSDGDVG
jgi:hypothetical protein